LPPRTARLHDRKRRLGWDRNLYTKKHRVEKKYGPSPARLPCHGTTPAPSAPATAAATVFSTATRTSAPPRYRPIRSTAPPSPSAAPRVRPAPPRAPPFSPFPLPAATPHALHWCCRHLLRAASLPGGGSNRASGGLY
jgi:hypothetical protein